MKVHELEHALSFVNDESEVEFHVKNDKGLTHIASPTHAQITARWDVLEIGELRLLPGDPPTTLAIHLEI